MEVSIDGLRKNLSNDVELLKTIINDVVNDEFYEKDDLVDALNAVITQSNVFNCVYDTENPSFNDISDVEVEHLEFIDDD